MSQLQILERICALEADIERAIESIAQQELFSNTVIEKNERHRILLDHFKIAEARKVNLVANKLLDIYLDEDEIEEAQQLPESNDAIPNAIKSFEARIADIREYHVNHRELPPIKYTLDEPEAATLETIFNTRERYGRCLDLENHYTHYSTFVTTTNTMAKESLSSNDNYNDNDDDSNSSAKEVNELQHEFASKSIGWMARMEYFEFISDLPQLILEKIYASEKVLGFQLYANFVEPLYEYLIDFYHRLHPLAQQDLQKLERDTETVFAEYWTLLNEHKHGIVVNEWKSRHVATAHSKENALVTLSDENDMDATHSSYTREYHRALSHGGTSVSGLVIPAPLKRFRKEFTVWPVHYIENVIVPLSTCQVEHKSKNDARVAITLADNHINGKAMEEKSKFKSNHHDRSSNNTTSSINKNSRSSNNNETSTKGKLDNNRNINFSLETLRAQLPHSIDEVKHICLMECKVIALLRSLLFKPLQQTSQTLLRDCARTAQEIELDRTRATKEFAESLSRVHENISLSSMESTLARAAKYQMEHNEEDNDMNNTIAHLDGHANLNDDISNDNDISSEPNGSNNTQAGVPKPREEIIGDDGKPIARWLVKLQQLDKNYICEVCGGTVYKGPKVFREHFAAERHTEGLRRLGVLQHLKEYEGISAIRLVIEMRDRLQRNQGEFYKRLRDDEDNEEMQDAQGKVITTREYRRLQQRRN